MHQIRPSPDVVWSKSFKAEVAEYYDEWLANDIHEYTTTGNLKPVPRWMVLQWILKSWKKLSTQSFKNCFFFVFFSLCIFSQVRNIPERIILISTTGLR